MIPAALFFDGGFSNIAPYSAEIFPVQLAARGVGLAKPPTASANSWSSVSRIDRWATNLITPKATLDAVAPAFLFLGACGLTIGLAFTLLGIETHGKPLVLDERELAQPATDARAMRDRPGLGRA
jgi:MFS transporter, putative metabolite:H+ symporter